MDGVPLSAQRRLVESLPDLGFTDVWSMETAGADAFTPLTLASVWAPALRLGTAVVPVHTRGPALLAMHAAGLAEAAPGRCALGIGASSPTIVRDWNGIDYTGPYQRCRDTLRFLRAAFTGEPVTETYESFTVQRFRLSRVPDPAPPLLLGALRPGMLRLAGREADGVVLNWLAATDVPTCLRAFAEGADGGPVPAAGKEVAARIFVCPTEDAEYARGVARRLIAGYLTVPAYAAYQRWLGREDALAPMWRLWAAGERREAAASVPDEVVDALVLHGSPEEIRAGLRAYADQGVTTLVPALLPTPGRTGGGADPVRALEAAVRAVAPGE